jgi:o-succinylbenzoate---CoA ligase
MGTIFLHQQSFSFEDIRMNGADLLNEADTIHQTTFQLAQQWLSGQTEFVFFTSGSTGIPKEIRLQRTQLEASAKGTIEALKLTSGEHILLCMHTRFIGGAMLLIRGLLIDAHITLQIPSANPLQPIAVDHPYTFASFTPMQLFAAIDNTDEEQQKLARFKHVLVGGGSIDQRLEEHLTHIPTHIFHTYGMTETVSHIALKHIGVDAFFKTLPGVFIRTDERGCLSIQSPSTLNEWVQTNDIVTLHDTQHFELLGRADDVINSGGIKILPGKIEKAIRQILQQSLTNIIVTGIPDAKLGSKLIAILESPNSIETLQPLLEKKLPGLVGKYEIPKQFVVIPKLAYTGSGKPDKAETLKMIGLHGLQD